MKVFTGWLGQLTIHSYLSGLRAHVSYFINCESIVVCAILGRGTVSGTSRCYQSGHCTHEHGSAKHSVLAALSVMLIVALGLIAVSGGTSGTDSGGTMT